MNRKGTENQAFGRAGRRRICYRRGVTFTEPVIGTAKPGRLPVSLRSHPYYLPGSGRSQSLRRKKSIRQLPVSRKAEEILSSQAMCVVDVLPTLRR